MTGGNCGFFESTKGEVKNPFIYLSIGSVSAPSIYLSIGSVSAQSIYLSIGIYLAVGSILVRSTTKREGVKRI